MVRIKTNKAIAHKKHDQIKITKWRKCSNIERALYRTFSIQTQYNQKDFVEK